LTLFVLVIVHCLVQYYDTNDSVKRQADFAVEILPLNRCEIAVYKAPMLYFDLSCGASGDMILASLVDLGVPLPYLSTGFRRLEVPGLRIQKRRTIRADRSCLQLEIAWSERRQREYRNQASILALLEQGHYAPPVLDICRRVLARLAEAESQVHGVPNELIHFHEIGAVDTIVDILGFALALEYLEMPEVGFSTLTVGSGTIDTVHGTLPVPAPATARMLSGFQVRKLDTGMEILTPTGCAILTATGRQLARVPEGGLLGEGFGCGQKEIPGFPDYLRVLHLSGV
jgi:uncharacterized protein (DUF111 family)